MAIAPFNRVNKQTRLILTAFYHHGKDSWLNCRICYEESFEMAYVWKPTPYWIDYDYNLRNNFYLIKDAIAKGCVRDDDIDHNFILIVPVSNETADIMDDKKLMPDFSIAIPLMRDMI